MYDLTPDFLESIASNSSIAYGKIYYDSGNVKDIKIINDKFVEATVNGLKKYKVFIKIHNGIYNARCTCAYDRDNFCKHKVAVLMALMDQSTDHNKIKISELQEKYLQFTQKFKELFLRNKN